MIKVIKYASIIFNSLRSNTISNSFLFNIVIILFDETMTVSHSWLTFDYFTLVKISGIDYGRTESFESKFY